jgi:Flp pilus assembly pilin Flp
LGYRPESRTPFHAYGLPVALIAVVSIVAIRTLGTRIRAAFEAAVAKLNNANI